MKQTNILAQVWPLIWLPLLRFILIIIGLAFSPRNIFNIIFTIIFINTLIDVLTEKELNLKRTLKRWLFTIIFIGSISTIYYLGGWLGVIGTLAASIIVILIIVIYTLHINWKLYDAVTTWGAKRIKGKTKKDFNIQEALRK